MTTEEVARILAEIADMLEFTGEVPYKLVAYRRAADSLLRSGRDVNDLWRQGELETVPGIGKSIAGRIDELLSTGRMQYYEQLREEIPSGLTSLLEIPDVGPKTAMLLYRKLGVTGISELERAAREGKIREVPGLGKKTEDRILRSIELFHRRGSRILLGEALPIAEQLVQTLSRSCPMAQNVAFAGSLRRMSPTIGDVDILATSTDPAGVIRCFTSLPQVREVVDAGAAKATVILNLGMQVDLMVLAPEYYGSLLHHFTGSKEHNIQLRTLALEKGFSLSEHGLARDGRPVICPREEDVYAALGLPWIPPELREGEGEIEAAAQGRLPGLLELSDIKGDLHMHTVWSDGACTVEEMALAARARGYEYICVTDHTKSLGIANGLDEARLRAQRQEIDEVNRRMPGFRVLAGAEVEIKADGSLDHPDEVLAGLDVVVASLHSGLRKEREQVTARLLRAMANPHVDIIAHPTGRIIQQREPADLDMERVFRAAAGTGTMLEINADPSRLDLGDGHVRRALELGVTLVVDSDAHHSDAFDLMKFGVAIARRGWAEARHVANTLSLDELLKRLGRT